MVGFAVTEIKAVADVTAQIIHRLYLMPRATTIILLLSTKVLVVVHQGNRQMR